MQEGRTALRIRNGLIEFGSVMIAEASRRRSRSVEPPQAESLAGRWVQLLPFEQNDDGKCTASEGLCMIAHGEESHEVSKALSVPDKGYTWTTLSTESFNDACAHTSSYDTDVADVETPTSPKKPFGLPLNVDRFTKAWGGRGASATSEMDEMTLASEQESCLMESVRNNQVCIMIKNINCRCSEGQLADFLNTCGLNGTFRSVHVPSRFHGSAAKAAKQAGKVATNKGFAFVVFLNADAACKCTSLLDGQEVAIGNTVARRLEVVAAKPRRRSSN